MSREGAADAIVIGAGVMGCSLAFHLARERRRTVLVFERERIGQGTTAACAGGVRAQFSTEANVRIGLEARRVLRQFQVETGYDAAYRPLGYLFLLSTDDEWALFRESVKLQRRCGVDDVVELTPAKAARLVAGLQTSDLTGATFAPGDGIAGPSEVTMGYAGAARRAGVRFFEQTSVDGFLESGQTIAGVRTARGDFQASCTVICAGPWSGLVASLAGVDLPIEPSRRHIFVTAPFPRLDRRSPMTIDFHSSFYFHPEGEGVLFGMSDPDQKPGFDRSVDWSFLDRVTPVAARRWPPLLDAPVRSAWAGLYEMTPDCQPLVGQLPERPGLWVAAGFSGHGFMMAPVVGRWLAESIGGGVSALPDAFAPDRFSRRVAIPERHVV